MLPPGEFELWSRNITGRKVGWLCKNWSSGKDSEKQRLLFSAFWFLESLGMVSAWVSIKELKKEAGKTATIWPSSQEKKTQNIVHPLQIIWYDWKSKFLSITENVLETMLHYCVALVNVLFLCKPPHLGRLNLGCVWKGEGEGMVSAIWQNRKPIFTFLKIWLKCVLVYTF